MFPVNSVPTLQPSNPRGTTQNEITVQTDAGAEQSRFAHRAQQEEQEEEEE